MTMFILYFSTCLVSCFLKSISICNVGQKLFFIKISVGLVKGNKINSYV